MQFSTRTFQISQFLLSATNLFLIWFLVRPKKIFQTLFITVKIWKWKAGVHDVATEQPLNLTWPVSRTLITYGHRNSDIATKIRSIRDTRSAIHGLDLETQIGMFHVDCAQLNADLVAQTNELEYRVKTDQLDRNRDLNRQINKDYEEIGHRLDIDIETTSDLGSFSITHSYWLKYWRQRAGQCFETDKKSKLWIISKKLWRRPRANYQNELKNRLKDLNFLLNMLNWGKINHLVALFGNRFYRLRSK